MNNHYRPSRGQVELIGYLLILVIVIAGVGLIVLFAGSAVDDFRDSTASQQVDDAFVNLQSTISNVALSHPGSREEFTLGLHGQPGVLLFDEDDGTIEVEIVEQVGDNTYETSETLLEEQSLRSLRYQEEERRTVYQGGGVFATDISTADDTTVSSPHLTFYSSLPPQCDPSGDRPQHIISHCDQRIDELEDEGVEYVTIDTLSFSVFTIDESSYIGDSMNIFHSDDYDPVTARELIEEDYALRITIESSYADEWGEHFEEEIGSNRIDRSSDGDDHVEVIIHPDDSTLAVQLTHTGIEFQ